MNKMMNKILPIVREAGEMALEFEKRLPALRQIDKKGQGIATQADEEIEKFLIKKLKTIKEAIFLAEESHFKTGETSFEKYKKENVWMIDPIDGTNNFLNKIPFYSVSVGYVENEEAQIGVVYNPRLRECFFAQKGKGAYYFENIDEEPIAISNLKNSKSVSESIVSLGFLASKKRELEQDYNKFMKLLRGTRATRKFGSAALDLCYVAIDRIDIYHEYFLKPWDLAAATVICQESGVILSNHNSQNYSVFGPHILAAKEPLYSTTNDYLNSFDENDLV